MCAGNFLLASRVEEAERENFLAEVSLVYGSIQNHLINPLQLAQAELRRQEAIGDVAIFQLTTETVQAILHNRRVVESQSRELLDRKPLSLTDITAGAESA